MVIVVVVVIWLWCKANIFIIVVVEVVVIVVVAVVIAVVVVVVAVVAFHQKVVLGWDYGSSSLNNMHQFYCDVRSKTEGGVGSILHPLQLGTLSQKQKHIQLQQQFSEIS